MTLGQENINTQVYTQLDATHCHIMTEYLQRYTLIGEPALLGRAVKILRLAAFAPALPPSMDYNIRVYVVEDTPDALEVWNLFLCQLICSCLCLIHFSLYEPRHEKNRIFAYAKTKTQISFAVTAKLISAFVFAT